MLLLLWNLMISKNKIKFLKTLKVKKYRIRNQKALLEGRRLIDEAINSGSDIETIWFTQNALDHNANNPLIDKIKSQKIIYDDMTLDDLEELSNTENSQGIIAEISIEKYADSKINSADSTEDLNYSFLIKTFGKLSESQKLKIIQILKNTGILKETG